MSGSDTKIALITGASRGLGAAMAEELSDNYHIMAVARTVGALEELDDRIKARGGQATLAPMDVTDEMAMATLCRGIYDRWGKIDLWVHTAIHATLLSPARMLEKKEFSRAVAVNVTATATLIAYVSPLLEPEAKVVFFDDDRAGQKFFGSYGATKAAQMALARSWQAETVNTGPKIHIESPPPMATALRSRFFPGEDRSALSAAKDVANSLVQKL